MNKKILRKLGFEEEVNLTEGGKCPMCGEEIDMEDFKDPESRREFEISGFCQSCQEEVFNA